MSVSKQIKRFLKGAIFELRKILSFLLKLQEKKRDLWCNFWIKKDSFFSLEIAREKWDLWVRLLVLLLINLAYVPKRAYIACLRRILDIFRTIKRLVKALWRRVMWAKIIELYVKMFFVDVWLCVNTPLQRQTKEF